MKAPHTHGAGGAAPRKAGGVSWAEARRENLRPEETPSTVPVVTVWATALQTTSFFSSCLVPEC